MRKRVAVALVALAAVALGLVIRRADDRAGFPGGTVSVVVAGVLPLLSPFIVLKELLVSHELEAFLALPLVQLLVPQGRFAKNDTQRPDYSDEESSWAALPWRLDTADHMPPGCGRAACENGAQAADAGSADVFFVSPTTFYNSCCWNAPHDDLLSRYLMDEAILPQQAMPFNGAGRVFSPRFRQMSGFAYFGDADDEQRASREQAIDVAYADVAAAFEHFLDEWNGERPIILAGHSQGSEHALRLLRDYFHKDGGPRSAALRERLVAAYLVGIPVYLDLLAEWGIRACAAPTDVGCVLSWQTYLEGSDPSLFYFEPASSSLRARRKSNRKSNHTADSDASSAPDAPHASEKQLCSNPLTWTAGDDEYAPASLAQGAMHVIQWAQNINFLAGVPGETRRDQQNERVRSSLLALKEGLVGAQCKGGILYVDHPPFAEWGGSPVYMFFPVWRTAAFPAGNLHPME